MSICTPFHDREPPCGESYHPGPESGRSAATLSLLRRVVLLLLTALGSLVLLTTAGASARTESGLVEVVVTLPQPSLAEAVHLDRTLAAAATTRHRLDLRAPASVSYVRTLAFAPAAQTYRYARTPFDPVNSDHATHVAGIAAGDNNTLATNTDGSKVRVSGVAPAAYLGNYKVLTIPTSDFGLDGNSPEIAAGIEQAVKDGMDVINLSLGEPEVEPSRDIVVKAINAAADAGVVPVIAAGNDFAEAGRGSVGSPGTAAKAITVAASTEGDQRPADE